MTDDLHGALASSVNASAGEVNISSIPPFDSESEEALALRYARPFGAAADKEEGLVYEFTRDPALLHQYYRIYEQEFKALYPAPQLKNDESEYDRKGHIMVVRKGKMCVGGARISVKSPRQPDLLPLEVSTGIRLEEHFPELKYKEMHYGQMAHFALLPDFRVGNVTRNMFSRLYAKGDALNLHLIFGVAPLLNARVYMQLSRAIGIKQSKVYFNIDIPPYYPYEEVKLYLFSVVNENYYASRGKNDPGVQQALKEIMLEKL